MAGLGLMDGLRAYQQGRAWRRDEDAQQREEEKQAKIRAANQAAMDFMAQSEKDHMAEQEAALAEWTRTKGSADGFQAKPYKADDGVMFRAAAVRGNALAKAGLMDEWVKNRAAIIPMQMQARQAAWQRFQTDGDHGALGAAMYDTIPDGKRVKAYDVADAPGPDGKSAGKKVRFQLDDGTVKFFKPEDVERMAKLAATDPGKVIENELARDLWKFKQETEGAEDRKTETHKSGLKLLEIQEANKGREKVAETRAEAAEKVATIRGSSRGSGGAGGGKGANVQSVQTDKDGYKVIVFRDGTTKRMTLDGKPVRSGDWSKRVDKLAKELGGSLGGFKKEPEELRAQAETMLAGEAVPAEDAPNAKPSAKPQQGAPDLSKFFR